VTEKPDGVSCIPPHAAWPVITGTTPQPGVPLQASAPRLDRSRHRSFSPQCACFGKPPRR